ncbi:bifunctional 2-C-methyl-D-erythritol 4-phosphate cytidylyltransferase/2-C-methyl-D-erythritol 2,4-cyclodiphosphate synthase [Sphingomonas jatrophae]|uniref:Bifunctional enzyme IspD/IspF n=1 Tax=Sphingomonas jatrophae TaxID=1166337 RepID=A0A1I6JP45_9SPHN|nr:bifunctional 2-C-methyl-D-erythritol 4-phosphate cytidylyltransferase/2-C-methyl-D-erythritol 2,4-cyclodiphosphate synthase [Sphingomonas jatrophae]SFR80728.1 2-C-methyl-D-erythritol 2,4-cyclodiphosphate synthase [Sphingomonas jatrophae]
MRNVALIVAAGAGVRLGGEVPKQYREVAGKTLLVHAIDALAAHPSIDAVQVVIGAGQEALYAAAVGDRMLPPPVLGGETRRQSVANGLAAITADRILVHDAARPDVPTEVIDRLLAALDDHDGAIPVLPIADTLARDAGVLGETVPRDGLVRVQTPQAFTAVALRRAHAEWPGDATDDAQMVRAVGGRVALVAGDTRLEKITFAEDVIALERRLSPPLVSRTGLGFDVHAFEPGDHVMLGGVRVAHDAALAGHSDADVVLHAIVDALLGAVGAGDIGQHFPPSDMRWKGADSTAFARHAVSLVAAAGGRIDHVDVTVICERPKVGPHRDAIRASVAAALDVPTARVSIKATTTEGLGFTGRREGIAAQAVATVRVPETI